jgi:hypothetical protein
MVAVYFDCDVCEFSSMLPREQNGRALLKILTSEISAARQVGLGVTRPRLLQKT